MIGLLIQGNQYGQDIRRLLMSFYPDKTYAHEVKDGLDFYVETRPGDSVVSVLIWGDGTALEGWELSDSRTRSSDLSDHSATRSVIKKISYLMLTARMSKGIPWGSLTDVRSTKIALTRLEEGWKEEDIRSFMRETYFASNEKIDLSVEIAAREKGLLGPLDYKRGYSLHVGIPFYPTTCLYCSLTSYPTEKRRGRTGPYLEVLFKELGYTARKVEGRPLDTVYFSRDTPTPLSAEDLEALLSKLEQFFDLSRVLKFTVEAGKPGSIIPGEPKVLRDHGITRISISPQTMNQKTLDLIGHHHTVEMVKERFCIARELGLDNINMDLIMGLPEENMDDVQRALEEIRVLRPDPLTAHPLTIRGAARSNIFREEYDGLKIQSTPEMIELSAACAREVSIEPYCLYRQKNVAGNFENVGCSLPGKVYIYNTFIMEEMQTIAARGTRTTTRVIFPSENHGEHCENVEEVEQYISRIGEMIQRKKRIL